jgi:predicted transcriptional regulator
MENEALLLSIRPTYATKIFSCDKSVELRKVRPRLQDGDKVLVYVSSPVMKLMGLFEVSNVVSDTPHKLWKRVGSSSCVTKDDFFNYYDGSDIGYGIMIKKVFLFDSPVSLTKLRRLVPGFTPPQCYRYLKTQDLKKINPFIASDYLFN